MWSNGFFKIHCHHWKRLVCKAEVMNFPLFVTPNKIAILDFLAVYCSWFSLLFHFQWYWWALNIFTIFQKLKPPSYLQLEQFRSDPHYIFLCIFIFNIIKHFSFFASKLLSNCKLYKSNPSYPVAVDCVKSCSILDWLYENPLAALTKDVLFSRAG
jgi:hypothetical protein